MASFFIIRFVNSPGFVGSSIDWATNSLFDHTEIGNNEDGGIDSATGWIGAHAGSGVENRALDYLAPSRERRYAVPVTDDQHARILAFAKSKIGTPYDYADIAGLLFHDRKINSIHKLICSMFGIQCAQAGDLQMLNVLPEFTYLITPETLHLSPVLIGNLTYAIG